MEEEKNLGKNRDRNLVQDLAVEMEIVHLTKN